MADVEKTNALELVESTAPPEGLRYVHIDPEMQKKVVRKLDLHLMPILMALCE